MEDRIEWLQKGLEEERNALISHQLYKQIDSIEKVKIFMENHVFAVWDFMSLLKALQINLTCTTLPWKPTQNLTARRLVNEIVFAEESDIDAQGNPVSHYEMYLNAMRQIGADTSTIESFVNALNSTDVSSSLALTPIDSAVKKFVAFTFEVINRGKTHEIAALFTFGREDLIPDMFTEIVSQLGENEETNVSDLVYYLDRHIELDGDEHGPLALKLVADLCGNDDEKWNEALTVSKKGLQQRHLLWSGILEQVQTVGALA